MVSYGYSQASWGSGAAPDGPDGPGTAAPSLFEEAAPGRFEPSPQLTSQMFDRVAAPMPEWVADSPEGSNARRWWDFHLEYPEVGQELRKLALQGVAAGAAKLGIKAIYEVLRWNRMLEGLPEGEYGKLDNRHTGFYARWLMATEPALAGKFETRELRSSRPEPEDQAAAVA